MLARGPITHQLDCKYQIYVCGLSAGGGFCSSKNTLYLTASSRKNYHKNSCFQNPNKVEDECMLPRTSEAGAKKKKHGVRTEFTVSSRSAVDKRITPGFRSYCTSKAAARFSTAASAQLTAARKYRWQYRAGLNWARREEKHNKKWFQRREFLMECDRSTAAGSEPWGSFTFVNRANGQSGTDKGKDAPQLRKMGVSAATQTGAFKWLLKEPNNLAFCRFRINLLCLQVSRSRGHLQVSGESEEREAAAHYRADLMDDRPRANKRRARPAGRGSEGPSERVIFIQLKQLTQKNKSNDTISLRSFIKDKRKKKEK